MKISLLTCLLIAAVAHADNKLTQAEQQVADFRCRSSELERLEEHLVGYLPESIRTDGVTFINSIDQKEKQRSRSNSNRLVALVLGLNEQIASHCSRANLLRCANTQTAMSVPSFQGPLNSMGVEVGVRDYSASGFATPDVTTTFYEISIKRLRLRQQLKCLRD